MARNDHRNSWDHWYGSARWQRLRAYQLQEHPLCATCSSRGIVKAACVVDHVEPHQGDWTKFTVGKLQSLCKNCHDSEKKIVELRGYSTAIGDDGWPTDPRHPAYKAKTR